MGGVESFLFGCLDDSAAELLKWWHVRDEFKEKGIPSWSRSWIYWIVTVLMVLAGGFLVLIYVRSGAGLNPILAFHVGASTPLIIAGLTKEAPAISPGDID